MGRRSPRLSDLRSPSAVNRLELRGSTRSRRAAKGSRRCGYRELPFGQPQEEVFAAVAAGPGSSLYLRRQR